MAFGQISIQINDSALVSAVRGQYRIIVLNYVKRWPDCQTILVSFVIIMYI